MFADDDFEDEFFSVVFYLLWTALIFLQKMWLFSLSFLSRAQKRTEFVWQNELISIVGEEQKRFFDFFFSFLKQFFFCVNHLGVSRLVDFLLHLVEFIHKFCIFSWIILHAKKLEYFCLYLYKTDRSFFSLNINLGFIPLKKYSTDSCMTFKKERFFWADSAIL